MREPRKASLALLNLEKAGVCVGARSGGASILIPSQRLYENKCECACSLIPCNAEVEATLADEQAQPLSFALFLCERASERAAA
jgi:hypothetical protein